MSIVIDSFIEEQEIRRITYHSPEGPVDGYQWRLLLRFPATLDRPQKTEWTPWVFGSTLSVDQMMYQWNNFLTTHGHRQTSKPPGESAH